MNTTVPPMKVINQQCKPDILLCRYCPTEIVLITLIKISNTIWMKISCNKCHSDNCILLKDFVSSIKQNKLIPQYQCFIKNNHPNKYCRSCRSTSNSQRKQKEQLLSSDDDFLFFKTFERQILNADWFRENDSNFCLSCQKYNWTVCLIPNSDDCKTEIALKKKAKEFDMALFFRTIEDIKDRSKRSYDYFTESFIKIKDKENSNKLLTRIENDLRIAYLEYEMNNKMIEQVLVVLNTYYASIQNPRLTKVMINILNNFKENNKEIKINKSNTEINTFREDCFNLLAYFKSNTIVDIQPEIQNVSSIKAHNSEIKCLIMLKDGHLASGARDCLIKLWNVKLFKCEEVLRGHKAAVFALIELRDGRLASGSLDKTIKLWDYLFWECAYTYSFHRDGIYSLLQVNDTMLASGSEDSTIKIWNLSSNEYLSSLKGHWGTVRCIINWENDMIISGSDDRSIKIWNTTQAKVVMTLLGHKKAVLSLILLRDGRLASCSCDYCMIVWDLGTREQVSTIQYSKNNYLFSLLQWSNDIIISGSYRELIIWDINTKRLLLEKRIHKHNIVGLIKINDNILASCSSDNTIKVWLL